MGKGSGRAKPHWLPGAAAAAAAAQQARSAGALAPQETLGGDDSHGDGGWNEEPAVAGVPPAQLAHPPKGLTAPGWGRAGGRAPGAQGSAARSGSPPLPGALCSQTLFSLPPVTPLPLLRLPSFPFSPLYAILRD